MLRVVGAGLGRTGTNSLKVALEQLLDGRCYHMWEAIQRPRDTPVWVAATRGEPVDWDGLLAEFTATVDWPAASFWRELVAANPDALVLLSTRDSAQTWLDSAQATIFQTLSRPVPPDDLEWAARRAMTVGVLEARFEANWHEPEAAMAAYDRHNAAVRAEVPPERLIDWRAGDGWVSICAALGVAVPQEDFPHTNSSAEFRAQRGLD